MPGICTSTIRHEVSFSCPALRKFSAESNAAARKPNDSMSRVVVLRTDSSSSMTEIKFLATLDLQWTQAIYKWTRNLLGIGGFCFPERITRVTLSFTRVWEGPSFFSNRSLPVRCEYQFIAFTAPQKTQAFRASLRVPPRIALAFSPLPGSDEPSRCFPQFRVDQQSAC